VAGSDYTWRYAIPMFESNADSGGWEQVTPPNLAFVEAQLDGKFQYMIVVGTDPEEVEMWTDSCDMGPRVSLEDIFGSGWSYYEISIKPLDDAGVRAIQAIDPAFQDPR
jgi:hypothetical protein